MKFCSECGAGVVQKIPEMDDRLRYVCESCGTIHYQNPNVVVGTLAYFEDKVLLCKRAIEPRVGYWTIPAGFMENGESTEEGAKRETREESGAHYSDSRLYRIFDIPYINQVYMFYLAELTSADYESGIESLEVGLFDESDIPWEHLAFPVIQDVLEEFFEDRKSGIYPVRNGAPDFKAFKSPFNK
jgi:ADP-ribose pyrophosphatase YjhB (NUDIX family)